ncbi:molybdate ABC transporter permease subunit [Radiobacillus kanasensis]|uniref:molybdate ABC transporter permease subunit n=1 Tax=Radiobacillus kanasensis TaxID=2844358 RepID=UPI001E4D4E23|nr:molybdate ABC transporter permease subunit [Radiobacillus kanasensis]UFT98306.1 molybdate ABC transporter permease subunit [Radiobacillus kanasensis]
MTFSWFPVQLSLLVSGVAAVLTFIIAVPIAFRASYQNKQSHVFLDTLFLLPLVLPPSVVGFFLIVLFGNNGPIGSIMEKFDAETILFTPLAAILAASVVAFPLMLQSAKAGFSGVDRDIVGAAKIDGGSNRAIFFFVCLPLAYRSLITGLILTYTRALGEFGATLMVAGNIPGKTQTIPTAIYTAIESGDVKLAWIYVLFNVGLALLFLTIIHRLGPKE